MVYIFLFDPEKNKKNKELLDSLIGCLKDRKVLQKPSSLHHNYFIYYLFT